MHGRVTDDAVIFFCKDILQERGALPVGEVGKILQDTTAAFQLSTRLKEKYGGLKKFLEMYESEFVMSQEHPFNPHVLIKKVLTPEDFEFIGKNIIPPAYSSKHKKLFHMQNRKAKAANAAANIPPVANLSPDTGNQWGGGPQYSDHGHPVQGDKGGQGHYQNPRGRAGPGPGMQQASSQQPYHNDYYQHNYGPSGRYPAGNAANNMYDNRGGGPGNRGMMPEMYQDRHYNDRGNMNAPLDGRYDGRGGHDPRYDARMHDQAGYSDYGRGGPAGGDQYRDRYYDSRGPNMNQQGGIGMGMHEGYGDPRYERGGEYYQDRRYDSYGDPRPDPRQQQSRDPYVDPRYTDMSGGMEQDPNLGRYQDPRFAVEREKTMKGGYSNMPHSPRNAGGPPPGSPGYGDYPAMGGRPGMGQQGVPNRGQLNIGRGAMNDAVSIPDRTPLYSSRERPPPSQVLNNQPTGGKLTPTSVTSMNSQMSFKSSNASISSVSLSSQGTGSGSDIRSRGMMSTPSVDSHEPSPPGLAPQMTGSSPVRRNVHLDPLQTQFGMEEQAGNSLLPLSGSLLTKAQDPAGAAGPGNINYSSMFKQSSQADRALIDQLLGNSLNDDISFDSLQLR
jgi:hypothetical protein